GRVQTDSFLRTYRGGWTPTDLVDEPLFVEITNAGFQPLMVSPSDRLRREKEDWILENPQAQKLPRGCMAELERIMNAERLDALVIVAPGPNSASDAEGTRMERLPRYVQGWGFSTSD